MASAAEDERPYGLLCLEGEWDTDDPISRQSVEPTLRLLEWSGLIKLVHRDVNTDHELWHHLTRWCSEEAYGDFYFLYLGFHGAPGEFYVGDIAVGLEQLGQRLEGSCADSIIYLASCGVLKSPDEALKSFCRRTGARGVVGYSEDVEWIESSAFDLLLFGALSEDPSMRKLHKTMLDHYGDLASTLGFRVATPTWVSPVA